MKDETPRQCPLDLGDGLRPVRGPDRALAGQGPATSGTRNALARRLRAQAEALADRLDRLQGPAADALIADLRTFARRIDAEAVAGGGR
jgi:hypothetical protein